MSETSDSQRYDAYTVVRALCKRFTAVSPAELKQLTSCSIAAADLTALFTLPRAHSHTQYYHKTRSNALLILSSYGDNSKCCGSTTAILHTDIQGAKLVVKVSTTADYYMLLLPTISKGNTAQPATCKGCNIVGQGTPPSVCLLKLSW